MSEFSRDEIRRAAAALRVIVEAGALVELRERIAFAWEQERERKRARAIGADLDVAIELVSLLRIDRQSADTAIAATATRSYECVKFEQLIFLAREIWQSQQSTARKGA